MIIAWAATFRNVIWVNTMFTVVFILFIEVDVAACSIRQPAPQSRVSLHTDWLNHLMPAWWEPAGAVPCRAWCQVAARDATHMSAGRGYFKAALMSAWYNACSCLLILDHSSRSYSEVSTHKYCGASLTMHTSATLMVLRMGHWGYCVWRTWQPLPRGTPQIGPHHHIDCLYQLWAFQVL